MLTLRQRIFIIISVAIGLILVFILLYYFVFKDGSGPKDLIKSLIKHDTAVEQAVKKDETGGATSTKPVFGKYSPEVYAKQVARIFVERFNSFSNQNNNQNIDDVLFLVTPAMEKWLKTQGMSEGQNFQGMTTLVLASSVSEITSSRAVVRIEAQQESEEGNTKITKQRTGRVELLKVKDDWKVDGFYWDK